MAGEREAGVDRIIAFSDGVVAIAITLLILPLTEIDRPAGATLGNVVVDNWAALFAFALSFAVIANYWTIHHAILGPLRRHNRRLIQLNMLWLAAIVFLPSSHRADRRWPRGRIQHSLHQHFASRLHPESFPRQLPRASP
jgi:TMEM175 potassium channel family protein